MTSCVFKKESYCVSVQCSTFGGGFECPLFDMCLSFDASVCPQRSGFIPFARLLTRNAIKSRKRGRTNEKIKAKNKVTNDSRKRYYTP